MKVAKDFKWEMGHRLSFHKGKCRNIHGHSYKLRVEFEGNEDHTGIVIDYHDIKAIIAPIVEKLDHSFMIYTNDTELYNIFINIDTKLVIVDFEPTAENICNYFLKEISKVDLPNNITKITARVFESEETYAENEWKI